MPFDVFLIVEEGVVVALEFDDVVAALSESDRLIEAFDRESSSAVVVVVVVVTAALSVSFR